MLSPIPSDPGLAPTMRRAIHDHRGLVLAEGVLLLLLGAAAVVLPFLAGLAAAVMLGWLLVIAGVAGLAFAFRARGLPGFGWSLLSGLAALIAGMALAWNPLVGLATLTLIIAAFLFADGIFTIATAISHRRELSRRWEWMLLGGIVNLVLAAIIYSGWPGTALWVVGLLVGVNLLFGGVSLVTMSLAARDAPLRP